MISNVLYAYLKANNRTQLTAPYYGQLGAGVIWVEGKYQQPNNAELSE